MPALSAAIEQGAWSDFFALCDCGGRLAGSASEAAALAFLRARLGDVPGGTLREHRVDYPAWRCHGTELVNVASGEAFDCTPLLGAASTPPQGTLAEVLDLGLGRPDDFARHAAVIRGRIVLVRHEYPFAPGHVHRRVKLGLAQERGAAGFLIAYPQPGIGPVSGSSGRGGGPGIPALGVGAETAAAFASATDGARPMARMRIAGEDHVGQTTVLTLDLPGAGPERIVVSAHVDGHPHGESAIDNATGVAVALALARTLAPHVAPLPRGLRICLFGAEEWGLVGSRLWLAQLDEAERRRMVLNINLDSVAGAPRLTALTSGFRGLDAWARRTATAAGLSLATHLPLMSNSDHANFAASGIPALRLIAGFDDPDSNLRFLLTAADTRDKVRPAELADALRLATALAWDALSAPDETLRALKT
jgi:aminopeptidase YwaD